eukprot:524751_1
MLQAQSTDTCLIGSNKENHVSDETNGIIIKDIGNGYDNDPSNKDKRIAVIKTEISKIDEEIKELNTEKERYLNELSTIANESTVVKVRNQSLFMQRVSINTNATQILDVISEMKKGTKFLKYGQFGSPHYHQFEITNDNTHLRWYSRKKKSNLLLTTIKLENILHLQSGHLYSQNAVGSSSHALSLSIAYKDIQKK